MDYLTTQNRLCAGDPSDVSDPITARGKVVVVIGGGDTGSDCVGTARRQGAKKIHQLEILPKPPAARPPDTPWPMWPRIMRTSSSHEEGCQRHWCVMTKGLSGSNGRAEKLRCCRVEWIKEAVGWKIKELAGTDFDLEADLVLLAMGFLHPVHKGLIEKLGLKLDQHGNVAVENYQTSEPWVFAAGDTVSGASLVVRAIDSGRQAAASIDHWLTDGFKSGA